MSALSSLGSDLSVSVSFTIARELLEGADEASISDDELVGIVLSISIVLTAVENMIGARIQHNLDKSEEMQRRAITSQRKVSAAAEEELKRRVPPKSGLDFLQKLISIARQVSFSIAIQLLAAAARAKEPSRTVRILSLISLVIFFLFVSSNGQRRIF